MALILRDLCNTLFITKTNKISKKTYEFVGPICESTDKFTTLKKFQDLYHFSHQSKRILLELRDHQMTSTLSVMKSLHILGHIH
mgnify:CR=1 FL=1